MFCVLHSLYEWFGVNYILDFRYLTYKKEGSSLERGKEYTSI